MAMVQPATESTSDPVCDVLNEAQAESEGPEAAVTPPEQSLLGQKLMEQLAAAMRARAAPTMILGNILVAFFESYDYQSLDVYQGREVVHTDE